MRRHRACRCNNVTAKVFPNAGGPRSRLLALALFLVTNTVHCSICYCFARFANYSGIAICTVTFCHKLLGNCNLQVGVLPQAVGELQFGGWSWRQAIGIAICRVALCCMLLGNCNLQGGVLPQAIGELQLAGLRFAASDWGIVICRVAFCRKLLGNCNEDKYCKLQHLLLFGLKLLGKSSILKLLSCFKLLGSYNLQGLALRQAIWELHSSGFCFVSSKPLGDCDLEALVSLFYAASTYWGIPPFGVLLCAKLLGNTDKNQKGTPSCSSLEQRTQAQKPEEHKQAEEHTHGRRHAECRQHVRQQ